MTENVSLLEISSDIMFKTRFSTISINKFWIKMKNEYPSLLKKAMKMLVHFATTYLCEAGSSSITLINNKFRNRLLAVSLLRLSSTLYAK